MSRRAVGAQRPALPLTLLPNLTASEWQTLLALLLFGLAVRVLALRAPPLPVDINNWAVWAQRLLTVGPGRFYNGNILADIGPAYVLLLGLLGKLAQPGTSAASLLFRLPAVLADLAIGAAIYIAVLQVWRPQAGLAAGRPLAASLAAALWLFNPAAILLSASWGQIESVYAFFLLLSVLALDGLPGVSLVSLVIALLIEPRAVELAPLVVIALIARHGLRPLLWPALAALALWCVLGIPFFGWNIVGGLLGRLYINNSAYAATSLNALNFWAIGGSFRGDLIPIVPGFTPFAAGLLLYGVGIWYGIVLLQEQLQRRTDFRLLGPLIGAYLLFLPYSVLTRQHDRWLVPVLPFLLVVAFARLRAAREQAQDSQAAADRRFAALPLILVVALSLFLLLDLYRVYEEGLYAPAAVPASVGLYAGLTDSASVWAALTAWAFWALTVLMPWWLPPGMFLRSAAAERGSGETGPVAYHDEGAPPDRLR